MTSTRLARFVLVTRDAEALARFFVEALGFVRASRQGPDVALTLGPSRLLLESRPDARPYPATVPGWSPLFQHFAIVAGDMASAYGRLTTTPGWTPISTDGPVLLPQSSGGVSAFKFRDPDGHPLEFLAFPDGQVPAAWRAGGPDPCRGIDHSAVSVADTARSVLFYESLGLAVSARSLNVGPEQARLDGLADPTVEVTGLAPKGASTPHLELLCYRGAFDRRASPPDLGDVAATRLIFAVADEGDLEAIAGRHPRDVVAQDAGRLLLRDPDGHLIEFAAP